MCVYLFTLDIQEFYEVILLDDTKDVNTKALAVLRIAEKWSETPPLPTHGRGSELTVSVGGGGAIDAYKKSPSFHSMKSEHVVQSPPKPVHVCFVLLTAASLLLSL
jgi:hypothetical protein